MTILSKLTLSDKTRAAMLTSPEAKLRGKMLEALGLQTEAAKAIHRPAGRLEPAPPPA